MRMHWYIFGPAWNVAEAGRELREMANAGIGGVLIFPAYPIALDDPKLGIHNQEYLSPEYLEVFRGVTKIARRLGLTVDTVLGTGWPYGGPSVTLEESAHSIGMLRPAGELKPGEKLIATFTAPNGETTVFYSSPTRMQVKRASLGAEGLIIDHYNPEALRHFLSAVGDKLVNGVRSIFSDSLEVYRATWTDRFPEIFHKHCGYDLTPHLVTLFDGDHPDSADVRRDFWGALSQQAEEAYVRPLREWAHSKGVTTQVESYGTPPVSIASYRWVDVPVGEHYEWKEFSSSRWASSGGHLAGKPVILAEAWTWAGLPNRFADTLEDLKLCSDLHFLSGINALYGLTYAYSPMALGSPGWVPYFGPAINHTSPGWPHFRYLVEYVNRASHVLQQGKPVADIAVYLPVEDAMASSPPDQLLLNWSVRDRLSSNGPPPEFSLKNALHYESNIVKTIITNGYAFDGVDTYTMNGGMHVSGGRLRMGDGNYSVLVLPNLTGIDLESAEKISEFARSGGTVIATKRLPDRAWGFRDRERRSARVRESMAGIAVCDDDLESFRKALRMHPPDIDFAHPSENVSFVHRRTVDRDFYFIANTSEKPQFLDAAFLVNGRAPDSWDLMTGNIEPVAEFERRGNTTRIAFELGPRASRVFVFADSSRQPRVVPANGPATPFPLNPRWKLKLEDRTIELNRLKSWTEIPFARFFSGRGTYEAEFDAPAFKRHAAMLDLGSVRETAEVWINDEQAGVAWMRPYRVHVTKLLRPGRNRIRVDVTNLLINRILGMGPIDYSKVYAKYGERFPPGDEWKTVKEPLPSGLLGPVRLVFNAAPDSGGTPRR